MKLTLQIIPLLLATATLAHTQEIVSSVPSEPATESGTRVTDQTSSDIITVELPKSEPIDFEVIRSVTERIHIEESPEMVGVPAPKGMINLTV